MPTITKQIDAAAAQLAELIEQLTAMIAALPENPRIRRINEKCFIISSKDLGGNWAPEHHDFRCQYRAVIVAMQRSNNALAALKNIITAGKVQYESGKGFVRLHPDVIVNLQKLL